MSERSETLNELVALAHHLGEEWRDYVIIGEGNTSARADDATFWVKASGENLRTVANTGFVRLVLDRVLELMESAKTDEDVTRGFTQAQVNPGLALRPSIETFLHALALTQGGARFVGHTHPVAVNAILCSQQPDILTHPITPDAITVCGATPLYVPYHDVGLALGRAVRDALRRHMEQNGAAPKVIYLQNHGLLALGQTSIEVQNITAMAVKNARVMAQTYWLGGPHLLEAEAVARIDKRPDETLRRAKFEGRA